MELFIQAIQSPFIIRALIVGVLVAISSSFLGPFLVLKKYSMIGEGLAHVSFAAVAIALLLHTSPLYMSIPIVSLASFAILKLNEKAEIHGDASIGLVSSFAIALGYLIISLSPGGYNVDISSYLFGSILLITKSEVILSFILSLIIVSVILFFYQLLFSITYDEEFSQVIKIKTKQLNYLISILTSITIVIGIRVVGTMLISSMIIFPTVTALQMSKGFKQTIYLSSLISVVSVILGIFTSILFDPPTGSTIVMYNAFFFILFFSIRKLSEH